MSVTLTDEQAWRIINTLECLAPKVCACTAQWRCYRCQMERHRAVLTYKPLATWCYKCETEPFSRDGSCSGCDTPLVVHPDRREPGFSDHGGGYEDAQPSAQASGERQGPDPQCTAHQVGCGPECVPKCEWLSKPPAVCPHGSPTNCRPCSEAKRRDDPIPSCRCEEYGCNRCAGQTEDDDTHLCFGCFEAGPVHGCCTDTIPALRREWVALWCRIGETKAAGCETKPSIGETVQPPAETPALSAADAGEGPPLAVEPDGWQQIGHWDVVAGDHAALIREIQPGDYVRVYRRRASSGKGAR